MIFTPLQLGILHALARYFFLTNSQLVLLRIGHSTSIREATRIMAMGPSPLLHVTKYPVDARFGRLEHVYSLSQAGHEALEELTGKQSLSIVFGSYGLDYFHRRALITFHILLDTYLNRLKGIVMTDRRFYFRKRNEENGTPRWAETRMVFGDGSFCIPDMLFVLSPVKKSNLRIVFSVEYVRGNKTARTLHQIGKHMKCIRERTISEWYQLPHGQDYVSLFLFEEASLRDRVLSALERRKDFLAFRDHFLLASYEDTFRDVAGCWYRVGDRKHLFNCISGQRTYRL